MPDQKTEFRRTRPTWDELLPSALDKAAFEDASAALEAGRYVRKLRTEAGLTQAQLAARIAVSQARISAIENGEGRDGPSYAVLKRIALACGVDSLLEARTSGIGATSGAAAAKSGEKVLALSEEQPTVGKRLVNRGTTRIRRFVVETPIEEAVTLRSEHVSVERRPVTHGTPASSTEFTNRTIEETETEEEAVVAKTAQIREEVVVNKSATERVETVRDTVRREDVEITRDGETTTGTSAAGVTPTRPKV